VRDSFLPFSPPLIGADAVSEVVNTLRSDWITTGPKVTRFERAFAHYTGAEAALAVASATDAMHVGLAALGVGEGDAVLTTPMTFCSTVHVIEHLGAAPILVDVDPDTLNVDPTQVAQAAHDLAQGGVAAQKWVPRTLRPAAPDLQPSAFNLTALLPVHLYGHPCDMDALLDVARDHHLAVVEDAAHALPAAYKGCLIGSSSRDRRAEPETSPRSHAQEQPPCQRLTAFSFYATKNMTTGEGGMLTGPPDLIEEARVWSLHGMSRDAWRRYSAQGSWYYEVVLPGFKCNMTDIQASLGIHQLRKLPRFQQRRREIARQYTEAFSRVEAIQTPTRRPEVRHAWHIYAIRLHLDRLTIDRGRFIQKLNQRKIGTSVHFIPVHLHPYYRDKYGYEPDDFPVAYREYQRLVSLPIYPRMDDRDVADVIEAVTDVVEEHRR